MRLNRPKRHNEYANYQRKRNGTTKVNRLLADSSCSKVPPNSNQYPSFIFKSDLSLFVNQRQILLGRSRG